MSKGFNNRLATFSHGGRTFYQAAQKTDGYLYSDWWADDGTKIYREKAPSWDATQITRQSLAPVIGLYRKADWELVQGFDEQSQGWEDWIFHLSLLQKGVCGTRVAHPLFTYR